MLPYAVYKYAQNKKKENRIKMDEALRGLTTNLPRSIVPDQVVLKVSGVSIKLVEEFDEYILGVLRVIEKVTLFVCLFRVYICFPPTGVFIEWSPVDDKDSEWVVTSSSGETIVQQSLANDNKLLKPSKENISKLSFSIDVNDLSSFRQYEPKKGKSDSPSIKFICNDGSSYMPVYFRSEPYTQFLDVLQRYITLRRSNKELNLVLVVDEKNEALVKSVTMLDQNGDILSRFMNNPYATALTGLGKITSFVQDQVIPTLLDSDEVSAEEQIRAMRNLRVAEEETGNGLSVHTDTEFEVVTQLELPPRPEIYRESSVTKEIWESFKLPNGSIDPQKLHHLKMNIFRGGLSPDLRKTAWMYLLNFRDWNESDSEFSKKRAARAADYERMKGQWKSISKEQEDSFASFAKRKGLVEKDVARTDRVVDYYQGDDNPNLVKLTNVLMTYIMYNFDLGYIQGMSDFASQILYIVDNEVDAFWCFVGLMNNIHRNFEKDQSFIQMQMNQLRDLVIIVNPRLANYLESNQSDDMYFCFRWVLVWFKREFSFTDTTKLWEVLWTGQLCPNFLLLICVAILDSETNTIIDNKFGLTEILKHVNDLSMHLDLDEVLTSAEAIFHQLSASQDKLPPHICQYLKLGDAQK